MRNVTLRFKEHVLADVRAECTVHPALLSECQSNRAGIERRERTITGSKKERNHHGTPIIRVNYYSTQLLDLLLKIALKTIHLSHLSVYSLWSFVLVNILVQRTDSTLDS